MKSDSNVTSLADKRQLKTPRASSPQKRIANRAGVTGPFTPDWNAVADCVQTYRQIATNAKGLQDLIRVAAAALRVDVALIEQLVKFEAGYPDRAVYRTDMPRDGDGPTSKYIGVTQASQGFWTDAGAIAQGYGVAWPRRPIDATLLQQLLAPFFYYLRYSKQMAGYPFTADTLYALHQQGPGAARNGFRQVAGRQSAASLVAVRAAASSRRVAL